MALTQLVEKTVTSSFMGRKCRSQVRARLEYWLWPPLETFQRADMRCRSWTKASPRRPFVLRFLEHLCCDSVEARCFSSWRVSASGALGCGRRNGLFPNRARVHHRWLLPETRNSQMARSLGFLVSARNTAKSDTLPKSPNSLRCQCCVQMPTGTRQPGDRRFRLK